MSRPSPIRIATLTAAALLGLLAGHTVFTSGVHASWQSAFLISVLLAVYTAALYLQFVPVIQRAYRARKGSSFGVQCLLGMALAAFVGPAPFLLAPPESAMLAQLSALLAALMVAGGFLIPFLIANVVGVSFFLPRRQLNNL